MGVLPNLFLRPMEPSVERMLEPDPPAARPDAGQQASAISPRFRARRRPDGRVARARFRVRTAGVRFRTMMSSFIAIVPMACVTAAAIAAMTAEAFRVAGRADADRPARRDRPGRRGDLRVSSLWNRNAASFGVVVADNFGLFVTWILIIVGVLSLAFSAPTIEREQLPRGEYYALMLFALAGMMLMATATDLLVIFLALEVLSLAVYVLTGIRRDSPSRDRSRVQVFPARRVLQRVLSLRHRLHLRRDRQHAPRSDRPPDGGAGGGADADATARGRPAARRVRVQGVGGAVSHVDAGRLRRRAAGGDRLHVHRREGRGVRRVRPRVSRRASSRCAPTGASVVWVVAAATMIVGTVVGRGAVERQADAGVLEHRPRRLSAGGAGVGQRRRQGRDALLSAGLRRDQSRRIRRHRAARYRRSAERSGRATTPASGTSIRGWRR